MAEREHPAAKAGRFVRAAGRASAAAAREFERQAAARPPAPAPAPAAARPAPPPALATHDFVGRTVFYGFVLALAMLALVLMRAETLVGGHEFRLGFRIAATAVLLIEAYLLTSNWHGANQRLGQRLLNRVWGPRGPVTRREKTFAHLLRDALILIGIAFLAGGVYELLSAAIGTS